MISSGLSLAFSGTGTAALGAAGRWPCALSIKLRPSTVGGTSERPATRWPPAAIKIAAHDAEHTTVHLAVVIGVLELPSRPCESRLAKMILLKPRFLLSRSVLTSPTMGTFSPD